MTAERGRLAGLAREFAENLTATVQVVAGSSCAPFRADMAEPVAFVRQDPAEGILLLGDDEQPLLRLAVEFRCTMDTAGTYLAVDESSMKVFSASPDQRDPLLRYEYVRNQVEHLPSAHLHVHGTHDALIDTLSAAGSGTTRGKRLQRSVSAGKRPQLRELHLPLGGHRFRPCLEDVMSMLIHEFGVHPASSRAEASTALGDARELWRRQQVGTCVRDAPEEAVRVLRELGYEISLPDGKAQPDENTARLRAL